MTSDELSTILRLPLILLFCDFLIKPLYINKIIHILGEMASASHGEP